uniref:Flagellar FliJ protein n=1 Tax=Bosea sp. NBC_00436 TaxID=2969620 RepID=A0A9E7ZV14_9HYPH
MTDFTIDSDVLAGYRRRADAARATLKSAYDTSRSLRKDRDELLAAASQRQQVAEVGGRRNGSEPIDFLHPDERERLTKIQARIEEAAGDERAAEREAERQNATAGRVVAYADKHRKAAEEAAFVARGEAKPTPPQHHATGYSARL